MKIPIPTKNHIDSLFYTMTAICLLMFVATIISIFHFNALVTCCLALADILAVRGTVAFVNLTDALFYDTKIEKKIIQHDSKKSVLTQSSQEEIDLNNDRKPTEGLSFFKPVEEQQQASEKGVKHYSSSP